MINVAAAVVAALIMNQSNTIETMEIISYHNHSHIATEPTPVPVDSIEITIVHSMQKLSCLIIDEKLPNMWKC